MDEIQEMVSFDTYLIDKCWTGEVHSPEEVMNRNGRENGGGGITVSSFFLLIESFQMLLEVSEKLSDIHLPPQSQRERLNWTGRTERS